MTSSNHTSLVQRTDIDTMWAKALSATPFDVPPNDETQCMHRHTQVASALAVSNPQYEKCVALHKTSQ